ncbi:MAG: hypothetical protein GXO32_03240 [Crenarchaeota archaeon]|nr:hypothetical protein [Thermoproteota archaeon]
MHTKHPVFLYSILMVHWGYIVRQPGATAAQAAYILPPPTTIVGAYGNPLARLLGIPDYIGPREKTNLPVQNKYMDCLVRATLAAGAGLIPSPRLSVGAVTYEEPSRIMGTPYKGGGDYQKAVKQPIYVSATTLLPVQAVGATSAPGALLATGWLVDADMLASCIGKRISLEDFEAAAWSVYRLGSREGLVHTVKAGVVETKDLDRPEGWFKSILYQDRFCVNIRRGKFAKVTMIGYDYKEREFFVPCGEASGINILLPPTRSVTYRILPGCKASGTRVELAGSRIDFYLAYRG